MRFPVSFGSFDNPAPAITAQYLYTEDALKKKGTALLWYHAFHRANLTLPAVSTEQIMLPTDTAKVKENKHGLVHDGIITSFNISPAGMSYTAEVIYQ